jgi:hypothetical protein
MMIPKDWVVLVALPLEDGSGYVPPGSWTIDCVLCQICCTISPASNAQWRADRPDLPHAVVCGRCLQAGRLALEPDDDRIIEPNDAVKQEVLDGMVAGLKDYLRKEQE